MQRRLPGSAAIRARLAGRFLLGTIYLRDFRNRNLAVHRVGRFFLLVALLNCEASAPVATGFRQRIIGGSSSPLTACERTRPVASSMLKFRRRSRIWCLATGEQQEDNRSCSYCRGR